MKYLMRFFLQRENLQKYDLFTAHWNHLSCILTHVHIYIHTHMHIHTHIYSGARAQNKSFIHARQMFYHWVISLTIMHIIYWMLIYKTSILQERRRTFLSTPKFCFHVFVVNFPPSLALGKSWSTLFIERCVWTF
jgi:hypothetical protein